MGRLWKLPILLLLIAFLFAVIAEAEEEASGDGDSREAPPGEGGGEKVKQEGEQEVGQEEEETCANGDGGKCHKNDEEEGDLMLVGVSGFIEKVAFIECKALVEEAEGLEKIMLVEEGQLSLLAEFKDHWKVLKDKAMHLHSKCKHVVEEAKELKAARESLSQRLHEEGKATDNFDANAITNIITDITHIRKLVTRADKICGPNGTFPMGYVDKYRIFCQHVAREGGINEDTCT